jgi:hypothetical protein
VEANAQIMVVNEHLAQLLDHLGFEATLLPPTHNLDEERLISDRPHKHVACISGLGSFGLHRTLITDLGCRGRLDSLVTNAKVEATPRRDAERGGFGTARLLRGVLGERRAPRRGGPGGRVRQVRQCGGLLGRGPGCQGEETREG